MAKSKATWNKKETEKKKQKKRQDKEQKKEERKANAKESNWEDMLAYVDENGNISSTPPDPTKKKVTKQEDIEIGVRKQEDLAPEDLIRKGTVSFFNNDKGYGFIKDHKTQESIFVHVKGLVDSIKEHDKVSFEVEMGAKGPTAVNVQLAK